jgi:hypothetical protein
VRVRTRAQLFVLLALLAGGLAAGAGAAAGTATVLVAGTAPANSTLRARLDVADATYGVSVVSGIRDPSGRERDSRRLDAAAIAGFAALVLGGASWIVRGRHARRRGIFVARDNRTRAPPCIPAFVCT